MGFLGKIAPATSQKLKAIGSNKIRAVVSLGFFAGFLSYTPVVIGGLTMTETAVILAISFALIFGFLLPAFAVMVNYLGLGETLFKDYSGYPAYIHYIVIGVSIAGVLFLTLLKFIALKKIAVEKSLNNYGNK